MTAIQSLQSDEGLLKVLVDVKLALGAHIEAGDVLLAADDHLYDSIEALMVELESRRVDPPAEKPKKRPMSIVRADQ